MASSKEFVEYVADQMKNSGDVTYRMMFGEYGVYVDKKLIGLICDNKLFIKPTTTGREFIGDPVEAPPYPGAKNSFLIEDKLEDSHWLCELIKVSLPELPLPKKKKSKR